MNELNTECSKCHWSDKCGFGQPCEHYYIPDIEDDDEKIRRFVERRREEYRRAWLDYIRDFDDGSFF